MGWGVMQVDDGWGHVIVELLFQLRLEDDRVITIIHKDKLDIRIYYIGMFRITEPQLSPGRSCV